jgi:hypothetical protein
MVAHSEHCGEAIWLNTAEPAHELRGIGWRSKQKTRRLLAHGQTHYSEHQFFQSTSLALTAGQCRKSLKHILFYAVDGKIFGYRSSFHSRVRVADSHLLTLRCSFYKALAGAIWSKVAAARPRSRSVR